MKMREPFINEIVKQKDVGQQKPRNNVCSSFLSRKQKFNKGMLFLMDFVRKFNSLATMLNTQRTAENQCLAFAKRNPAEKPTTTRLMSFDGVRDLRHHHRFSSN
jgi:hypothetical protein